MYCILIHVTTTGEGMQILTYARHSWPFIFASQGFLIRTASQKREAVRIKNPWLAKMMAIEQWGFLI